MEPLTLMFQVTDGQESYVYEDIEAALEHIRQGVLDNASPGDEYSIEIVAMSESQVDALHTA